MYNWKSCYSCGDIECAETLVLFPELMEKPCSTWVKTPCPYCGGAMSEIKEHNGRCYRHCYSCHMEPEVVIHALEPEVKEK